MAIYQAVMEHNFTPSIYEPEANGILWIQGQPIIQVEFHDRNCPVIHKTLSKQPEKGHT